jgi:hypothetical protein
MSLAAGHSQGAIPGARFMDPSVLARIGNLELVSRAVVDGFINGMHKAPYFGASVDFAEHRGYVPGGDIRRVGRKLWARTDSIAPAREPARLKTGITTLKKGAVMP